MAGVSAALQDLARVRDSEEAAVVHPGNVRSVARSRKIETKAKDNKRLCPMSGWPHKIAEGRKCDRSSRPVVAGRATAPHSCNGFESPRVDTKRTQDMYLVTYLRVQGFRTYSHQAQAFFLPHTLGRSLAQTSGFNRILFRGHTDHKMSGARGHALLRISSRN